MPGKRHTLIANRCSPDRSGTTRKIIIDLAVKRFVYVSRNPATLARDLSELHQKFSIQSITPLDMFPQTAEIEVVAGKHDR